MKLFSDIVARIDGLSPRVKAAIIAASCGVFGVVCGGVLYVVFAHLFEHGEVRGKLIGTGIGLVVSVIIAWFADRLWAAIDDGSFTLGEHARRTVIAVVSLVIVFELSASAFEDFVRAYWSDRQALIRIAGDIAGRDLDKTFKIGGGVNGRAFVDHMRAELGTPEAQCEGCVPSAAMRLYDLLPRETRIRVFATWSWPRDDVIQAVLIAPKERATAHPYDVPREEPCWLRGTPASGPAFLGAMLQATPAQKIYWCRRAIVNMTDDERAGLLKRGINEVLARPDLYDAGSFRFAADKSLLELGHRLTGQLSTARQACDAIAAKAVVALAGEGCIKTIRDQRAIPGSDVIPPISEIRLMNWQLLSAAFGDKFIEPPMIDWWDLGILFAIWSAAAIVLGVYLTIMVFESDGEAEAAGKGEGWRFAVRRALFALAALVFAAMVAGAVLVAARLLSFLWELMFDPLALNLDFSVAVAVPWLVQWLSNYGLGFSIPGYVSLPLIVGGVAGVWIYGLPKPNIVSRFAGFLLIGILATCVLPVFEGLTQVVLIVSGAWIVPTLGLTFLLPTKPVATLPQWWGGVALAAGLFVAFWVGAMLTDVDAVYRGLIAVAGLLVALTGFFVTRQVPVGELWPLIAVTAGLTLVGGAVIQQVTFSEALNTLRPVSQTPVGARTFTVYDSIFREWPDAAQQENDTIPKVFQAGTSPDIAHEAVRLELALTGSIGFWLTIGTLVAWSLKIGVRKKQ